MPCLAVRATGYKLPNLIFLFLNCSLFHPVSAALMIKNNCGAGANLWYLSTASNLQQLSEDKAVQKILYVLEDNSIKWESMLQCQYN